MEELFRMDAEAQTTVLTEGLLGLERDPGARDRLDALMRAAHSLKGAARMVGYDLAVHVAHAMEDAFDAARAGTIHLSAPHVDVLLHGVDLINRLVHRGSMATGNGATEAVDDQRDVEAFQARLAAVMHAGDEMSNISPQATATVPHMVTPAEVSRGHVAVEDLASHAAVRVTAEHLNRLIGLAGESLVVARSVPALITQFTQLKHVHNTVERSLTTLREVILEQTDERTHAALERATAQITQSHNALVRFASSLDVFDRRLLSVSHQLYEEVLAARMRPFADGIQAMPRMVRDLARSLGKHVHLEIDGEGTLVDRDILQRIEAPLVHLLRNVIDHGIESPDERHQAGKPSEGQVTVTARHNAGMLLVSVTDDGRGIDAEIIRQLVVERNLTTMDIASKLSNIELLEFLFLPGFSTKHNVTEISGRGVGLDAVMTMVHDVGGSAEMTSRLGQGTSVQLKLPLTLSVIRALIAEVAGEPYAIPLTRVARVLSVPRTAVHSVEGHEHIMLDDRPIGLVSAPRVLGARAGANTSSGDALRVVVLGDRAASYGLVVDTLQGERELVVRPLDARLGKVATVSAAAFLDDGSPVLILDVDDVIRAIEVAVSGGRMASFGTLEATHATTRQSRRVLVVDDSITVRETERKLLEHAGYAVDVAVDGMDGWNAVRTGSYDLVLTDIDMPRLNGIELTTLIRKDPRLTSLPVMIVSYKDREEDRLRGLDAGADYYLTKASFHDDTLLRAVADLIGEE